MTDQSLGGCPNVAYLHSNLNSEVNKDDYFKEFFFRFGIPTTRVIYVHMYLLGSNSTCIFQVHVKIKFSSALGRYLYDISLKTIVRSVCVCSVPSMSHALKLPSKFVCSPLQACDAAVKPGQERADDAPDDGERVEEPRRAAVARLGPLHGPSARYRILVVAFGMLWLLVY